MKTTEPGKRSLTERQKAFVREYLIDLNATAAYKRAGYNGKGRAAENAASRLLVNVGIAHAIQTELSKREKRSAATVDRQAPGRGKTTQYIVPSHQAEAFPG